MLKSVRHNRHYIGITKDVDNRLSEHNFGEVRSTKAYRPWVVVHTEHYHDKTGARKRELFLKRTAKARKELFNSIEKTQLIRSS